MEQNNHEVVQYPLGFLKFCGQSPYLDRRIKWISTALFTLSFIPIYISILANFFYVNGNVILFVENCEALSAILQQYGKVVIFALSGKRFLTLINITKSWNFEGCSSAVKKETELVLKNAENVEKLYGRGMMMTAALVMITPLFTKQCVTGMWNIPDHDNLYIAITVLQGTICPFYLGFISGIDGLFVALSMLLVTQFKVLCSRLRDLQAYDACNMKQYKTFSTELKECIKLHDFLLGYGKLLSDTYSPIMLLEFLTICMTSFAELYLILNSDSTVHFVRGVLLFFTFMLGLVLYCVPATITTDEAMKVADAIYDSDWYSKYVPKLSTTLVTMTSRAQHKLLFTAGGLADINLNTLITVCRFAWAVCTVMKGLHRE